MESACKTFMPLRPKMTAAEAEELGYKVMQASPFEVGLSKNGKGIRTWFAQDFGRMLPSLTHPLIQESIQIEEKGKLI